MPQLFSNGARSELASPITATSTSITLKSLGEHFPACNYTGSSVLSQTSAENWIKLVIQDDAGFEIVYCYMHEASTNVFSNLKRGQEDTTARVFAADSVVGLRPIGGDLQDLVNQTKANTEALVNKADKTGDISGNAATATKLKNPVAIGGVLFDGASNIDLPGVNNTGNQNTTGNAGTATKLQTPRNITVGGTAKAFDGTAPIAFSLAEVGAAAAVHSHTDASTTVSGFMSAADKVKLNAVATGATNDAPVLITQGADLGAFTKPGLYYSPSIEITESLIGKPAGLANAFALDVRPIDPTAGTNAVYQSIYEYSSVKQWGRAVSVGGSTGWDRVYSEFSPPPVATPTTAGFMSAADKLRLDGISGGGSLFDTMWHNGPRTSIATGFVAMDGQQLSYLAYPELCEAIWADKQNAATDADWLATPTLRNKWSKGDGAAFVRVPDLNAVQSGTGKPFYVRGGPDGLNGSSALDAMQGHFHEIYSQTNSGFSATASTTGPNRGDVANATPTTTKMVREAISDGVNGTPRIADETRVKTAYGVWVVRVVADVNSSDSINTSELLSRMNVMEIELNQFLESGAGYMFERNTWGGSRLSIPVGFVPRDGQIIYDAAFPEACAAVRAGQQLTVTETVWQADPLKRGMWSLGDGSTWMRVPDSNGMQVGSIGGLVEAGDYGNTRNGEVRNDAFQGHTFTFAGSGHTSGGGGVTTLGTQSGTRVLDGPVSNGVNGTPRVADETRGKTEYGIKIIRLYGEVVNAGSVNVPALVNQIAELQASIGFTYVYPNNGTAAAPATVAMNTRYEMDNPFPGYSVDVLAELFVAGGWTATGFIYAQNGGYGTAGGQVSATRIAVQVGSYALSAPAFHGGAPSAAISASITAPTPCRLVVTKRGKY